MPSKKIDKYVIERTHKITGAVFYLTQGQRSWVTPVDHERRGKRYGRWDRYEAVSTANDLEKNEPENGYTYLVLHIKNFN